jgi:ligand-binding sensor domain-containing protein/signal transduction histidine kinase
MVHLLSTSLFVRAYGRRSASRSSFILLALGCLLFGLQCEKIWGQTLSPQKVLGRYQQFIWLEEHGLPQNTVNAILRTRDGYLWVGTEAGAARFDGVRFTVFDHGNTKEFKGSVIKALLEDRAGNLWLGADTGGLNLYRAGRFSFFTTKDGLPNDQVGALVEDREGAIWIATYGGLTRFQDGRFTTYTTRDGLPDVFIHALTEDAEGGLWVGTRNGLARLKDGRFSTYTTREGLPDNIVRLLCRDRAGGLWVATDTGLRRFKDGRMTGEGLPAGLANSVIQTIYQDREGTLWVAASGGRLFCRRGEEWTRLSQEDLSAQNIRVIYQDPDDTLWIGTESGLRQLRDGRFQVYSKQDGLLDDYVATIYEDAARNLWAGTSVGVNRIQGGKITTYSARDGLPAKSIYSIDEDEAGNLWFGGTGGLSRLKEGRFVRWSAKDGLSSDRVAAVMADRAGNLWVGTYGAGLNLFRDGRFTAYTTRDGLASDYVKTLYEDRAGNLWVGTKEGGISRVRDGRITTWINQDGRARNFIASFYEDRSGALWIGTIDDGLSRFKDGKFAQITVRDGLYDNMAFQILSDTDDDSGNLWMCCNRGVFRVSLKELNDFADGRIKSVTSFAYGVADGMLSRECNAASPAGWRTRDGRLWFPTIKGMVAIDPRRLNAQPPQLAIEGVSVARAPVATDQVVQLRPGQGDLEIQYTGLSWSRPQQIRFKYQLIGLDQTWVEAGTRRAAYYSYLPPGSYTFKVIADNGEGVWNTEGKSLRVVVLPPFYRTWWFLLLAACGVVGLIQVGYKIRLRRLRQRQLAQENFARQLIASQEKERKRIASELHDSLGQSLVIIRNWALLGASQLDEQVPAREELDEITATASQAIGEVREIAYNLGPYHLDRLGLAGTIQDMVNRVAQASKIHFTTELEPIEGALSRETEMNLYRIAQETINNLVKHAHASEARLTLRREAGKVRLTVADNGQGFDLQQTSDPGKNGFGLHGIAERVRLLRGAWEIHSAPGQGTKIEITVGDEEVR